MRNAAGIVAALLVGLGCSACGGKQPVYRAGMPDLSPPKGFVRVLSRTGVGTESLGTVNLDGNVDYTAYCPGRHAIHLEIGNSSVTIECRGSVTEAGDWNYRGRYHVTVRAAPREKWSIVLGQK